MRRALITFVLVTGSLAAASGPAAASPGPRPRPSTGHPSTSVPTGLVTKAAGAGGPSLDSAGQAAVNFAMSQVGKPYIYGATGPYGYDCSGLAMAAWAAAGVQLPRTAAEQYHAGAHLPLSQVEPGDLIFWASDPADPGTIYHVAISLGGDRTVQATQTGQTVRVVALWASDLVPLATRP